MSRRRTSHGSAAVELAVVIPILVVLLFGLIQIGLGFYRLHAVHSTARDAANVGATLPGGECDYATNALSDLDLTATCRVEATCPGEQAVVVIQAKTGIDFPFVGTRTLSVSSRAEAECSMEEPGRL